MDSLQWLQRDWYIKYEWLHVITSAFSSVTSSLMATAHSGFGEGLSPASVSNLFSFLICSLYFAQLSLDACHRLMVYLCFYTLQSKCIKSALCLIIYISTVTLPVGASCNLFNTLDPGLVFVFCLISVFLFVLLANTT